MLTENAPFEDLHDLYDRLETLLQSQQAVLEEGLVADPFSDGEGETALRRLRDLQARLSLSAEGSDPASRALGRASATNLEARAREVLRLIQANMALLGRLRQESLDFMENTHRGEKYLRSIRSNQDVSPRFIDSQH